MAAHPIDAVQLAFDAASLTALHAVLAFIMFGVALDLTWDDLARVARDPKAPVVGLVCQILLLPAMTFALATALPIPPSMVLGMLLVAACPGGNMSNFLTQLAGGRVATSVTMTAISTLAAVVVTPAQVAFWGARSEATAPLVRSFALDPVDMAWSVAVLLLVPVAAGMATRRWLPRVAAVLRKPMQVLSLLAFIAFVAIAFQKNVDHFLAHIGTVFVPVALMNGLALALGWGGARSVGLAAPDRRAVAVEVGIQNSGLGLVLVFDFFDGLGGMAVVAAWWGIWHLVSGLTFAGACRILDARGRPTDAAIDASR